MPVSGHPHIADYDVPTLGTLIGLIPKDHHRQTLFDVQTNLESALIEARRIFIELHVAAGGAS